MENIETIISVISVGIAIIGIVVSLHQRTNEKMDRQYGELNGKMDRQYGELNNRIDAVNDRMDSVNQRLDTLIAVQGK